MDRSPSRLWLAAFAALALTLAAPAGAGAQSGGSAPEPAPVDADPGGRHPAFAGNGMWIWQLPRAYGGDVARIVEKARRHNVTTIFLKSGDGVNRWRQFTPAVVSAFKRAGLRVCGWQYVYGTRPLAEAYVSAYAKRAGADCFVVDAETEYEGRYVAADQYVRKLRALVGRSYPLSLASYPYVDYHPSFPYSVFLAPGRAQANQPQMYWHTIGTSVDANVAHTYTWNRIYKRPIYPLGQTYGRTPPAQIRRFRQVADAYGAAGVSWWEWTQTLEVAWRALGDPVERLEGYPVTRAYPRLRRRARGDHVVWAQQHLWTAGHRVRIDGVFGTAMRDAVLEFQRARGLPETGVLDDATWPPLLRHRPVTVRWRTFRRTARAHPAARASARGPLVAPPPRSATSRHPSELPR